jgi:hypothetical protein
MVKLSDDLRDTPGLKDNTIVLIASDNGPEPGAGSPGPFKGHKSNFSEGGVREPFIVWAPGLMEPSAVGTTNDVGVVAGMDFPPSILERAGVLAPAGVKYDAQSFARLLVDFILRALILGQRMTFPLRPHHAGAGPKGVYQHHLVGRGYPESGKIGHGCGTDARR